MALGGGKLGQLNELRKMRSQAMALQKELEKEVVKYEKGDIVVKVNGAQKVEYVGIDGEERKDIREAINKAMKDVQKKAAKKMMDMGGGFGGLFGG
ncbi:YbaB/EbfC family nucleoid-associated protein [Patescibacteria group bacterium]